MIAVMLWTAYKAKFEYYEFDGKRFRYRTWLIARWYSPFYWLSATISLILYLFNGGIIEWIKGIWFELIGDGQSIRTLSNSFKDNTGWLKRRLMLFRLIYTGV